MVAKAEWIKKLEDIAAHVKDLHRRTQAGHALVGVSIMDNILKEALLARMVDLSNTTTADLFEGYGPLASFSAKIDVAFALGVISKETRGQLLLIKRIRNAFAHTTDYLDFNSPAIVDICSNLPGFKEATDIATFYITVLKRIEDEIEVNIKAAREQRVSPGKSDLEPQSHTDEPDLSQSSPVWFRLHAGSEGQDEAIDLRKKGKGNSMTNRIRISDVRAGKTVAERGELALAYFRQSLFPNQKEAFKFIDEYVGELKARHRT
jgi:DNA-binding MltR family transcriptional regulator